MQLVAERDLVTVALQPKSGGAIGDVDGAPLGRRATGEADPQSYLGFEVLAVERTRRDEREGLVAVLGDRIERADLRVGEVGELRQDRSNDRVELHLDSKPLLEGVE